MVYVVRESYNSPHLQLTLDPRRTKWFAADRSRSIRDNSPKSIDPAAQVIRPEAQWRRAARGGCRV